MTNAVYTAIAYLQEIDSHNLITPEEFFNEFIKYLNAMYKEYCEAIFDVYDKDVEMLRWKQTLGSTVKESQLTKITMHISEAGEAYSSKDLSTYFNEWFEQWMQTNVYTTKDTSLCFKQNVGVMDINKLYDKFIKLLLDENSLTAFNNLKRSKVEDAKFNLDSVKLPAEEKNGRLEEYEKRLKTATETLEKRKPEIEKRKEEIQARRLELEKIFKDPGKRGADELVKLSEEDKALVDEASDMDTEIKELESEITNAQNGINSMKSSMEGQEESVTNAQNNYDLVVLMNETNDKIQSNVEEMMKNRLFELHDYIISVEMNDENAEDSKTKLRKWFVELMKNDTNYFFDQYGVLMMPLAVRQLVETGDLAKYDYSPSKVKYIAELKTNDAFTWSKNGSELRSKLRETVTAFINGYTEIIKKAYLSEENKGNIGADFKFTDWKADYENMKTLYDETLCKELIAMENDLRNKRDNPGVVSSGGESSSSGGSSSGSSSGSSGGSSSGSSSSSSGSSGSTSGSSSSSGSSGSTSGSSSSSGSSGSSGGSSSGSSGGSSSGSSGGSNKNTDDTKDAESNSGMSTGVIIGIVVGVIVIIGIIVVIFIVVKRKKDNSEQTDPYVPINDVDAPVNSTTDEPNPDVNINDESNPIPNVNINDEPNPNVNINDEPNPNVNINDESNPNPNPNVNINDESNPNPNVNINDEPNPDVNINDESNPNPNPNVNINDESNPNPNVTAESNPNVTNEPIPDVNSSP